MILFRRGSLVATGMDRRVYIEESALVWGRGYWGEGGLGWCELWRGGGPIPAWDGYFVLCVSELLSEEAFDFDDIFDGTELVAVVNLAC